MNFKMQRPNQKKAYKLDTNYKMIEKYIIDTTHLLGKGTYGKVYSGHDTRINHQVAIKQIPITISDKKNQSLRNQIRNMQLLNHQNIVKLYDVKKSTNNLYLITEYCNGGSIESLLHKNRSGIGQKQAIKYIKQIINGFKCLYQHSIVHRDLKPANVLFNDQYVKVADFGFSKLILSHGMDQPMIQSCVGTPQYMSPQILQNKKYSSKSDIWSLGYLLLTSIIFYQLLYGRVPWKANDRKSLQNNILSQPLLFPEEIKVSDQTKLIIQSMLSIEEEKRIPWQLLFTEPIFNKVIRFDQQIKKEYFSSSLIQIQSSSNDIFQKSLSLCRTYFQTNKVLNSPYEINQRNKINKLMLKQQTCKQKKTLEDKTIIQQQPNINMLFKQYRQQRQNREHIDKVVEWVLAKRNKATFYNLLVTGLRDIISNDPRLDYPPTTNKILFILLKYSTRVFYILFKKLRDDSFRKFGDKETEVFKNSKQKVLLQQFVKYDLNVCKLAYDEMLRKIRKIQPKGLQNVLNNKPCQKQQIFSIIRTEITEYLRYLNGLPNLPKQFQRYYVYLRIVVSRREVLSYSNRDKFQWNKFYQQQPSVFKQLIYGLSII